MALNNEFGAFLNVHPPRLEDAGLEDTALPAHAIQQAFRRAAEALQTAPWQLRSTAATSVGGLGIQDEKCSKSADRGTGLGALGEKESCAENNKAGGHVGKGHDLVVGPDVGLYESDKVEFGKEGGVPKLGDKGCVEGLPGDRGEDKITTDEAEDGPILVLG